MNNTSDLKTKLKELPDGYIAIKNINNKKYYYLKYYENGKQISKYIKEIQIEKIKKQLLERKKIKQEIKDYETSGKNMPRLSDRAKSLTGSIMSCNKEVAKYENGILIYKDEKLCPLYIKRTNNIASFLKGRVIDSNRTNSRLLKKVLNINTNNEEHISLYAYGAVITDNYWFKPKGSKLKYKDICFENDFYSDLALKGELVVYPKKPKHSPQITAIGSFEKCWKKIDGEWWLYKKGTSEQIFSEIFSSLLAKKMNIPTAIYKYDDGFIKSKNFATKYNFEPMLGLVEEEDYDSVFNALLNIDKNLASQYLLLSFFDCLINNIDRHNENLGFLRDKKTGKIISLAPNFDNNLALLGYDAKLIMEPNEDEFIKLFLKFLKSNKEANKMFKSLKVKTITKETITSCLKNISLKFDDYDVVNYVYKRYKYLINYKNKKQKKNSTKSKRKE